MLGVPFYLLNFLKKTIPASLKGKLKVKAYKFISSVTIRCKSSEVLEVIKADLLYCPFTAPYHYSKKIPVVATVLDLQYKYYPDFFSADDRYVRNKNFVRRTVLDNSSFDPDKVKTVHLCLANRLPTSKNISNKDLFSSMGLEKNGYLFYPANFWKHKNHEMLFTAFGMYKKQNQKSQLKLVCTGAPGERLTYLKNAITKMRLENQVIFPGYLSENDFAVLLSECKAVIFPSLYEGFGIPVIEAMRYGKPVLCSNVTSLPEVAEEAALLFDPRKPHEICSAMERVENDQDLVKKLIINGYKQAEKFCDPLVMAREYLEIFNKAMQENKYES